MPENNNDNPAFILNTNVIFAAPTRRQSVARTRIAMDHPLSDTDGCARCGCSYYDHNRDHNGPCLNCRGQCPRFLTQRQAQYAKFFDFYRWCRKWLKAGKRTPEKLRQMWLKVGRNSGYCSYCPQCRSATVANTNATRVAVKRQDGLLCASCKRCSTCCACVACERCKRRTRKDNICATCNNCTAQNCCYCRTCNSCRKRCDDDTCNNCGYCNTCCLAGTGGCGDIQRVPFYTSYNRKPKFYKPSLKQHVFNPTERYIAAEIEVAGIKGYGRPIYQKVKDWQAAVVYDGSLPKPGPNGGGGFEINTAPAGGDCYVQQVRDFCTEIKNQNGFVSDKCGLHIHVDARDLSYYDVRRLVRIYAAIEPALFAMVPASRSQSRYCVPCGQKYIAAIEEGRLPYDKVRNDVITSVYANQGSTQDLRSGKYHPSRYNALNLHSWFYRGTIECRMFDGSIDADTISNWGILWAMLLDYAVKTSDDEIAKTMNAKSFTCLAKIVEAHSKMLDFLKARVVRFGNEVVMREMQEYEKSCQINKETR